MAYEANAYSYQRMFKIEYLLIGFYLNSIINVSSQRSTTSVQQNVYKFFVIYKGLVPIQLERREYILRFSFSICV
jgi:hypothetical protein